MSVNSEDFENSEFRRWKPGNLNFIGFLENSTENLTLNRKYITPSFCQVLFGNGKSSGRSNF